MNNNSNEYFNKSLTILIGGHGSGKSEFAIMWAKRLTVAGRSPVMLIDLDTIKPMFRTQEVQNRLEQDGIELIISSVPHSDMPAISPKLYALIGSKENWMVVDVGGDAVGTRILASIKHRIRGRDHNLFYVLNASRPFNADAASTINELRRIEAVSGMPVTGLISNTHMLDETTPEIVHMGMDIAREISDTINVAFVGVMVEESLAPKIQIPSDVELFPIRRMLNPYWQRD